MPGDPSRAVRLLAIVIAAAVLTIAAYLVLGAVRGEQDAAVGELPSVAEVVAAQAHGHGISVPELGEEEIARLSSAPVPASSLSAFDQVTAQLSAVVASDGLGAALMILADVAKVSPEVAAECPRVHAALVAVAGTTAAGEAASVEEVCPRSPSP